MNRLNVCCPVRGGIRWLQPPSLPRCLVKDQIPVTRLFPTLADGTAFCGAVQSRTGADSKCPFGQNFPVYSFATAKLFRNPRADSREHVRANAYKSGAIIGQRVNQVKRHYHQKRKPRQALQGQPGSVCFDIQNTSARSLASIRRAVNPPHCSFPKSNQQRFRP